MYIWNSFSIDEPLIVLKKTFKELNNFYLYKDNKNEFESYQNNNLTNEYITLERKFILEIEQNIDIIKNIIQIYFNYKRALNDLKFIYDISEYQNDKLESFYKVLNNLSKSEIKEESIELEVGFLSIGEIDVSLKFKKDSNKNGENDCEIFNKDWESIINNKAEEIEIQILNFKDFVNDLYKEIYLRSKSNEKCFKLQLNDLNFNNEELLEKEFDKQLTFFKLAKNHLITYENKDKYIEIIKNELKYSFHKFKEYLKKTWL